MARSLFFLFFLMLAFQSPAAVSEAQASTVVALNDAQLVGMSDAICYATILGTQVETDENGRLVTRIDATVHEWLKRPDGFDENEGEILHFYTRGGKTATHAESIMGEAHFSTGEQAVLFLERVKKYGGRLMVLGLSQGAFFVDPIASRADSAAKVRIFPKLDGAHVIGTHRPDFLKEGTLRALLERIREELRSGKTADQGGKP